MRVTLAELKQLALETNGRLQQLAAGVGRDPMVFLHWSAGRYGQDFEDYHIRIDEHGEIYCNGDLTALLAHTWHHNTGGVGVALLCAYNANTVNLGDYPPTDEQIETMAQVIAVLSEGCGIPIEYEYVKTHAEIADDDNYGPATSCERWDLWFLKIDQAKGSGGTILRDKAKWYLQNGVGV